MHADHPCLRVVQPRSWQRDAVAVPGVGVAMRIPAGHCAAAATAILLLGVRAEGGSVPQQGGYRKLYPEKY